MRQSARLAALLFLFSGPAMSGDGVVDSIWGTVERPDESEVDLEEEIMNGVKFGGRAELSYQQLRRTTEQTLLNSRVLLGFQHGSWGHAAEFRANQGEEGGDTTAERYQANFKSEYSINETDYLFGAINSEKNRIDNIDLRTVEALGYGRRLLRSDRHRLDTEIGLGARQVRYRDALPTERSEIVRLGLDYRWNISDSATLEQTIQIDRALESDDNTRSEAITSISAALVGELALTVSLELVHNTEPGSVDVPRTQTITSVGLSYRF